MTQAATAPAQTIPRTIQCRVCGDWKPETEFSRSPKSPGGRQRTCMTCRSVRRSERQQRKVHASIVAEEVKAMTPSLQNEEEVAAFADSLYKAGQTPLQVGATIKRGEEETRILIAAHRATSIDPSFREVQRQLALMEYEEIIRAAREKGDLKEARLAVTDKLRAVGVIQQGGPALSFTFNQQNNALVDGFQKWMDKQGLDSTPVRKAARILDSPVKQGEKGGEPVK